MTSEILDTFALSNPAKADPDLIDADREHFAAVSACLKQRTASCRLNSTSFAGLPAAKEEPPRNVTRRSAMHRRS